MLGGISAVQVYLRAGWSLGNVQDRYIFAGAGGDQLVGRAVSGLPTNDQNFSILPPHFSQETLLYLSEFGWEKILIGYENYPTKFQRAVPFFLASIIHHLPSLRNLLPPQHPLWLQRIFSARLPNGSIIAEHLRGKVLTGHRFCVDANMHATGIPSHLAVAHQVDRLREELNELRQQHTALINQVRQEVVDRIDVLPDRLKDTMLQNFVINNVAPITINDFQRLVDDLRRDLRNQLLDNQMQLINQAPLPNPAEPIIMNNNDDDAHINLQGCKYFTWGGSMGRLVPQNYQFLSTNVQTAWNLWHYGHPIDDNNHTFPLKRLQYTRHFQDINRTTYGYTISKTNKVMVRLQSIAVELGLIQVGTNITNLPRNEGDVIFIQSYDRLCNTIYVIAPKRKHETILSTIANKMCNKRVVGGGGQQQQQLN
jgi:hypothetical protein